MRPYRISILSLVSAMVAFLGAGGVASAYTDQEIGQVFRMFDMDGDGKITRAEYNINKVHVIYRNEPTRGDLPDQGMTFADTRVSREYFDSVDRNHNGTLSPTEILEALKFENLEKDHAGYFEIGDLRRFMTRIGR